MNLKLNAPYTKKEIITALKHMHPYKSPGPDGMSPVFFKKFWNIVGSDVLHFVLNFLNNGAFDIKSNFTHIVLIPKINKPVLVSQFRPISLCNVVYKLASKAISLRLRDTLPHIISESQSAFIPGRLITDNVLLAYEIHHHMRTKLSSKTGLMSIKLDMSKAFDRVEWIFLRQTLLALGYDLKFVDCIMRCVSSVSFSFLLNGCEFGSLKPDRGIRQGDPLSPYLFIICSEIFSCILQDLQKSNKLHGIAVSRSAPSISHLFFADDTLLLGHATIDEARYFRFAINLYEKISGQQINLDKSGIVFCESVNASLANTISSVLGIKIVEGHNKYLGLPSIAGRNKRELFAHIKDRIWRRIQGWNDRSLSKARKEILIKSVLQSIPVYAMSCFRLSVSLISDIHSMIGSYWWGSNPDKKKIHWVSWTSLTRAKTQGGLGFKDLRIFNLAMLGKQAWRLLTQPSSLLARVLQAKYYPSSSFMGARLGNRPSWTWRSIMEGRRLLLVGCRKQIYSGRTTRIWGDRWIPKPPSFTSSSTSDLLPRNSTVNMLFNASGNHWNTTLINRIFPEDEARLIQKLPVSLMAQNDKWTWHFSKSGKYTVKSAYHTILTHTTFFPESNSISSSSSGPDPIWKKLWKFKIPSRILHFAWRFLTDSLPSPSNLERRGIVNQHLCSLCRSTDSSLTHLFFLCPISANVWYIAGLSEVIHTFTHPVADIWARNLLSNSPSHVGEFFLALCNAIWYARNLQIFDDSSTQSHILVAGVSHMLHSFRAANSWPERDSLSHRSTIFDKAPRGTHIFFDGAMFHSREIVRHWNICSRFEKVILFMVWRKFREFPTPSLRNLLPCMEALLLTHHLQLNAASIIGDSVSVLLAAKKDADIEQACLSIFEDIWHFISSNQYVSLFWISRNFNSITHELAQFAKHSSSVTTSWEDTPNFLSHSMLDDFQQ
ncbi:hypothetical protein DH2020_035243 [Rehmannia glutinosa]|uniref:Reverse transcriptase domain-containing protein n=1 Tax=Rehmannia glutinosa TaxID=99300 RepID=A0ABR0V7Q9_REHGL